MKNRGMEMAELLTAAQMRAIEAAAIASGKVTGLELMERAGRGVVEAIFAEWPELAAGSFRAVVLCGPGNNGGDGFVVARLLKEWGWAVEVFLYGDAERLPPDARMNYERWRAVGEVRRMDGLAVPGGGANLVVDAIFGTGLSRPLPAEVAKTLGAAFEGRGGAFSVGVDCASGECMDSGKFIGDQSDNPFDRDLIVQFHRAKVGQYLEPAAGRCGSLRVVDIGLPDASGDFVRLAEPVQRLGKGGAAHKYTHGHALILSGGVGHGGAGRMAARGALRIGAGLVTVGCPHEALPENAARLDAVMLKPVHDARELRRVLEDRRINALCLGPGMGVERAKGLLAVALASGGEEPRPTVLDADALTALAQVPALFAMLHPGCVLTPHGGEFARLFPDIAARLEAPATTGPAYSKVDACREAAARAGCVVLFKGADTVIADPSGRCSINSAHHERAAPWLATAGSGDVLAGFIAGLLARGFGPMQAAETGAWLHVECARSFGPGLIAEDLADELPKVFRALGPAPQAASSRLPA
jgi:hydroxyethylthiazole kinase-like uncharacterized protein yjeF